VRDVRRTRLRELHLPAALIERAQSSLPLDFPAPPVGPRGFLPLCALTGGGSPVMHNFANVLVVVASLCLLITLVLAWCLVGVRSSAFMKKLFPNYQYLLKAHIDYLLMTVC
jgi:hypothetical protein